MNIVDIVLTAWLVVLGGVTIISVALIPFFALGMLWDTWHKAPGRHNSWPYVRAIPPTKINHHPIHWQDPK